MDRVHRGGPWTQVHVLYTSAPAGPSVSTQSQGPLLHSVAESVNRARNMMERSREGGAFRRLGMNERLRSASPIPRGQKSKQKRTKGVKEKPFEFALLGCKDDDAEDDFNQFLKKDMIVERGIVTLGEQDSEDNIREKIATSLKEKYSIIGPNDFEFVKVTQKKISVLHLSKGTEYSYDVVKKMVGQGLLYIRMKMGFEFVLNEHTSDSDPEPLQKELVQSRTSGIVPGTADNLDGTPGISVLVDISGSTEGASGIIPDTSDNLDGTPGISGVLDTSGIIPIPGTSGIVPIPGTSGIVPIPGTSGIVPIPGTSGIIPGTSDNLGGTTVISGTSGIPSTPVQHGKEPELESARVFFCQVVNEFPSNITEPTEMLRYLQKKIVTGRPLDVTESSEILEGETNYITVDRQNILKTTFEELKHVTDPRVTFEVQFYGEQAVDTGGPRKEWIRLCNRNIKDTYFDNGLKEHLSEDYYYVGQMVGIALLQNGQLPVYIPEEILQAIFIDKDQELSPCVEELKRGMDTLGIPMFGRVYPMLLYLLRPCSIVSLTVRKLLFLLEADFSEEGCNLRVYEKAIYAKFVKYLRDVSSGRRVVTLENILEFVTGASEEPPLGFARKPCIQFPEAEVKEPEVKERLTADENTDEPLEPAQKKKNIWHFMPTSHACSNTLDLPRGNAVLLLPSDNELFELYDLAFKNSYFGFK
ncbi:hypothetical protein ACROYT_G033677 [Oculina patagonica]